MLATFANRYAMLCAELMRVSRCLASKRVSTKCVGVNSDRFKPSIALISAKTKQLNATATLRGHVGANLMSLTETFCMSNTHFGFQQVDEGQKANRVRGVFDSVASKYDVMNDLMSMGLHRVWKAYTVGVANLNEGDKVLDIAGGTGDLAKAFSRKVGPLGTVVLTDINEAMLRQGRERLEDEGMLLATTLCDAEKLPFASGSFDLVSVAFGLRNMTHKDAALAEMNRVLRPGGRLLVLEFSKVAAPLEKVYDWYSFKVLPQIGKLVAGDADSYQYLAESIRMHPGQAELKRMMKAVGFGHVDVHNLSAGVVALHVGVKC
jgi:demethylmenaquinone methyltransferase / 2-methoxy-6-polyprenyl-1,4-benzoquinol methylase